ncbi:sensor histidine kinase [Cohnella sp. OV330]|uniref:sensor histidine kinase n=1 Tax=Cohnella sp. OV330 TaxID=1855288 RepID=UPI001160D8B8|nr:sensor histidine kinase [Cohnella sp. OV330]
MSTNRARAWGDGMLRTYLNMSLTYKIVIFFSLLMTIFSMLLGYYAFRTSEKQIVSKVSATNQGAVKAIDNNVASLQRAMQSWVTVFSIAPVIQTMLAKEAESQEPLDPLLYSDANSTLIDQMLVTGNFDYVALYGRTGQPLFQLATDDSSGPYSIEEIRKSAIYRKTVELNGTSFWFPLTEANNTFIQNNRNAKIGMTRVVRNIKNGRNIGFIFVGVNVQTVLSRYLNNMYDKDHGIVILDADGVPLLSAGMPFYDGSSADMARIHALANGDGSGVVSVGGEKLLLSYSTGENGWQILYAVPLSNLTRELNSIKLFVILTIAGWLLLCIPILMLLSSFLTAPLKKLLLSMRRFQNGQFDEKIEVKYGDEIGHLGRGYNSMVANIKTLVDDVYVLRLREQEAELKALQSQINPHFLYNMLDTIFWEAEAAGQDRISEMIINLSRLFRLSLNRGKSFTSVAKERELLELYLSLQQMRFKDLLAYEIDIPDEIGGFVILKLSLQPFVENAIVHGIERKRGGGRIRVSGVREGDRLRFRIEDNGPGMSAEMLERIREIRSDGDIYTAKDTGGYAVQNVQERLRHFYKDNYRIAYISEPGQGTVVEIEIPATTEMEGGKDA